VLLLRIQEFAHQRVDWSYSVDDRTIDGTHLLVRFCLLVELPKLTPLRTLKGIFATTALRDRFRRPLYNCKHSLIGMKFAFLS
jgi:hypothetical protein